MLGWLQGPPTFLRLLHYLKQLPRLGLTSVVTLSAQTVIEVYDDSILVARMDPQDANNPNLGILRITIYDESIEGPGGATIGMSYNQTPGSSRFDCFPGEEYLTGYVICRSPDANRIQYIYGPIQRESRRPMMELPPENVLGNARLDRLVWLNWEGR